jgi:hypothetical protein
MPFKKNTSGNPKGRPKKEQPAPIKNPLENLLEKNLPIIEQELEVATPDVRRSFFTDLAGAVFSQKALS